MATAKTTWQKAEPWVLGIGGLAIVIAGFKFIPMAWNKIFPPDPAGTVNTHNLSFAPEQYKSMADRLEVALSLFNTDEATVYQVLNQLLTGDDLKQLINSFGLRPHGTVFKSDWTLQQWLTDEMDSDELQAVQNRFNQLGVPF